MEMILDLIDFSSFSAFGNHACWRVKRFEENGMKLLVRRSLYKISFRTNQAGLITWYLDDDGVKNAPRQQSLLNLGYVLEKLKFDSALQTLQSR